MRKVIAIILIIISIYCFYIGIYEFWKLSAYKMDGGLGEFASLMAGIFGTLFGLIFAVVGLVLLKYHKKLKLK